MTEITKYVDNEAVNKKLNLEEIKARLSIEKPLSIILCATKKPMKKDRWVEGQQEYLRVILDYNRVLYSQYKYVMKYVIGEIEKAQV